MTILGRLAVCMLACTGASQARLDLNLFAPEAGKAVCNDGSPSGYYFRAGDPTVWVVHFQGGFQCWDNYSCAARFADTPDLMSSKAWSRSIEVDGLFNVSCDVNPRWCTATAVYLPYCSSDAYTGTVPASPDTFGWHFRGRDIVNRLFDELVGNRGFGAQANTELLLSGCSAGGRGALMNADYVGSLLPVNVTSYSALFDSPYWIDIETPYLPGGQTLVDICKLGYTLYNVSNIASEQCLADHAGTEDQWRCFFPESALPYVKTPSVTNVFLYDAFQLPFYLGRMPPYKNDSQLAFIQRFHSQTVASLNHLDPPRFAPACFSHCSTEQPRYYRDTINGVSLAQVVVNFVSGQQPIRLQDACDSFECGAGCFYG